MVISLPTRHPEFGRLLFDENGDALFLIDPETDVVLEANETGLRLMGFAKSEVVGCRASDLFRFESESLSRRSEPGTSEMRAAAAKTTVFHGQAGFMLRIKASPGWLPVTVTVTRLHTQPKTSALYTVRDDTDRRTALARARQAEAEVRKSESRFRALVERSADGILVLNERVEVQYASPTSSIILGYPPAFLIGRSVFDFIHLDDHALATERLREVMMRENAEMMTRLRIAHADGGWREIELSGMNRIADANVGGIVLNYRDVTERVRTERELHQQNALLKALFNAIPDLIYHKNREQELTGGNSAFDLVLPIADDWQSRCEAAESLVLLTGEATRAEEWLQSADGQRVLYDLHFSPVKDPTGETIGLVAVGRDVTARKRLEDQLREAQKMEAIGQLAGGVAHDFNNLLTVVLGNLELARAELGGHPTDELLKSTERAARRAAELTSQLLGFARRQALQVRPVDLGEHLVETANLLRRTIDPRIVILAQPRPHAWLAQADPNQVNQILMNLCLNARDAMPTGGRLILSIGHVSVAPDSAQRVGVEPGDFLRLRVRDTGTGMPPESRARIFEPFFTTKEIGQGTGLGLAMVFGITKAHGGWIDCDSELGVGTTFDIHLPRHTSPHRDSATPQPTPSPFGAGERILVADDEPLIRNLVQLVLKSLDYHVTLAEDGADAVAKFQAANGKFDLVVLDLTMPNLSGRDALSAIRAIDPTMRIMLASGYSADRDALSAAGIPFLNKPYTPGGLARAVRAAIDGE